MTGWASYLGMVDWDPSSLIMFPVILHLGQTLPFSLGRQDRLCGHTLRLTRGLGGGCVDAPPW